MSPDLALMKSLAATVAVLWLACIVIGLPPPERSRILPGLRFSPRVAVAVAASIGLVFLALAALEVQWWPRVEVWKLLWPDLLEAPSRTLSSGAAFVAVAVLLSALAAWLGARTRAAARGAMLFALVLLAGSAWPALSIPRWCEWIAASDEAPLPSPLALPTPGQDPARWLDSWSRDLQPIAPWLLLASLGGIATGAVLLFRASKSGDVPRREMSCATIALCGVLAACLGVLEFEKLTTWTVHWRFEESLKMVVEAGKPSPIRGVLVCAGDGFLESSPDIVPLPDPPRLPQPIDPAAPAVALVLGLAAALFGEFHLRGRRVLRPPEPAPAAPVAP